jgi:hypothetical protein
MKVLKICMIALSMGIFISACKNNTDCKTSASDSTAMPQTTTIDRANAPMAPVTDTQSSASMNGTNNATENENGTNAGSSHAVGMNHRRIRRDTLANGPDLKASKKREGNFTNGTGADNIGR